MSKEKNRAEAARWLRQAENDFDVASKNVGIGAFNWACFLSQQAAEKAVKAFWYFHGQDPWGHSVQKLIEEFPDPDARRPLLRLLPQARRADKLYIPTRYPNGLPDLAPADAYGLEEAEAAIADATEIVEAVRRLIGS